MYTKYLNSDWSKKWKWLENSQWVTPILYCGMCITHSVYLINFMSSGSNCDGGCTSCWCTYVTCWASLHTIVQAFVSCVTWFRNRCLTVSHSLSHICPWLTRAGRTVTREQLVVGCLPRLIYGYCTVHRLDWQQQGLTLEHSVLS